MAVRVLNDVQIFDQHVALGYDLTEQALHLGQCAGIKHPALGLVFALATA